MQVQMMRHPDWAVPEPNKAWVWVVDLICAMVYVLLLRDLEVSFISLTPCARMQ